MQEQNMNLNPMNDKALETSGGGGPGPAMERRSLLRGLVMLGTSSMVAGLIGGMGGCQSGGGRTMDLPGPLWPDEEGPARVDVAPIRNDFPTPPPVGPLPSGVIPRSRWTAARPNFRSAQPAYPMGGIARLTVHHDGMPPATLRNQQAVAARLEQIRRAHTQKGWADIGYHYAIDPMGNVWECRPIALQGAHVHDANEHNIGVLVLGNFEEQRPTTNAIATLDQFVPLQAQRYRIPLNEVKTHRERKPTACPGRNLQGYMIATRARSGRMFAALA